MAKRQKVTKHYRYSKKKKKKYPVSGYSRPVRKKGRKLKLDPKPIVIKRYIVRDKSGHFITTTEHPIQFRKKFKGRLLAKK